MVDAFSNPLIIGAISVAVAVVLTLAVRRFPRKFDFVARPKSDRWHKRPTAMLGGAAIFLTTLLMYAAFVPKTTESLIVLAGSVLLFIVGLLDDILNIKPYQKLVGQLFGAVIVVGLGLKLPITGYELVDIWITVFWLIGITNAINLLDNMDGLAAGIAAIGGLSLALGFAANGQGAEILLISVFIGALIGFLIFNFNPASIFMGDCGSMFVGFLLASSVLLGQTGGRSRGIFSILAVPVLILFVPIFDTTFVTVLRKMWGRKASQGGRDHTSHRLVALGLSERSAVLMIYVFSVIAGTLSLIVGKIQTSQSIALIVFFTIVLAIIGVYLSKVKVYEQSEEELATRDNAVFAFIVNVSYKRPHFRGFPRYAAHYAFVLRGLFADVRLVRRQACLGTFYRHAAAADLVKAVRIPGGGRLSRVMAVHQRGRFYYIYQSGRSWFGIKRLCHPAYLSFSEFFTRRLYSGRLYPSFRACRQSPCIPAFP